MHNLWYALALLQCEPPPQAVEVQFPPAHNVIQTRAEEREAARPAPEKMPAPASQAAQPLPTPGGVYYSPGEISTVSYQACGTTYVNAWYAAPAYSAPAYSHGSGGGRHHGGLFHRRGGRCR